MEDYEKRRSKTSNSTREAEQQARARVVGLGRVRQVQVPTSQVSQQSNFERRSKEKKFQNFCRRKTQSQLNFQERNSSQGKIILHAIVP